MSRFDDYLASVNGQFIDVDGSPDFNIYQCWDLWSHYAQTVFGIPLWYTGTQAGGGCGAHPFYTCGVWYGFDGSGLNQWFTPISADQPAQPGDVVIWEYGTAVGPLSHIAIVVEDRGGSLLTMTQNPGAAQYRDFTKAGVLGYLRPDDQSPFAGGSSAPAVAEPAANNVVRPGDGYWHIAQRVWGGDNATIEANMNKLIELNGAKRLYAGDTVILDAPAPTPAPVEEIVVPTPVPVVEETKVIDKVVETPTEKVKEKPVEKQLTAKEIAAIEKRQKAVFAAVNSPTDLGAIITNSVARKAVWAVYGVAGLFIIGIMGGMTATGMIAPDWFMFACGSYTALGPAFASLAVANIKK